MNDDGPAGANPDVEAGRTSPSTILLERQELYETRLRLRKAALEGDWSEAWRDENITTENGSIPVQHAAITEHHQTILHIAAGARQTNFVRKMLTEILPIDFLTLQDRNGNTAFCYAASVGDTDIAGAMLGKQPTLLETPGGEEMLPLYMAALFGQSEMASFLYEEYPRRELELAEDDLKKIFFISIQSGLYDFVLQLLRNEDDQRMLALARHSEHGTALHMLARDVTAFKSSGRECLKRCINLCWTTDSSTDAALEIVRRLWKATLRQNDRNVRELISSRPTPLLFDAAKLGNVNFLSELIRSYPDLVFELDENGRSIFHIALMNRHTDIFSLIYDIGFDKDLIATTVDNYGNNLLHLAAKYSNPKPVRKIKVPGAVLEMQLELILYKEVEKLVRPSYKQKKNSDDESPWEVFTRDHKELMKEGDEWMKSRAKSCSIVGTLVATVVFQTAFTLPGGNNDGDGSPNFLREEWFNVFSISAAIAFYGSLISVLTFLSILTSRYKEIDFLGWLPFKLMVGLLTLFISITAMTLSFSSSIFLIYPNKRNALTMSTFLFVFLLFALSILQHFRLLKDIFHATLTVLWFAFKQFKKKLSCMIF